MDGQTEKAFDIALHEQHKFVVPAIAGARRVLEVGAGRGILARRLQAEGFSVTALDLSLPAKDASGVQWVEADFLAFDAEPFDAVLFTTSLHHIAALDRALDRARALVAPGGAVVIDDFDLEAPDETTARWYFEVQELLAAAGLYDAARIHGRPEQPALDRWHAEHEHHDEPLHPARAMLAETDKRFGSLRVTRGAYLYRYLAGGIASPTLARHIMAIEASRVADGSLRAVGLRIVARCHS